MSAFFVPHFLKGRRYLITGATGGAGSRTAIEISRVGGVCTLVCRDLQKGSKVLGELMGQGHGIYAGMGGGFDGIFHASGHEVLSPLSANNDSKLEDVFGPAVEDLLRLLSQVGHRTQPLVKDGGSIVLMSSVAAIRGQVGMSLYCASKAAIEGLTRAAAVELAPRRIRVNCIRAGGFASPMHTRITQHMTPEAIDAYASKHLFGFGRPEDIAHAALFLLGDTSRWITGTALTVDGGMTAK